MMLDIPRAFAHMVRGTAARSETAHGALHRVTWVTPFHASVGLEDVHPLSTFCSSSLQEQHDGRPVDPLEAVARACAGGDAAATRRLLEALAPILHRVVGQLLGPSHADVDDRVQEALVGVVRALPSFRWECSVTHFASRIAVRRTVGAREQARAMEARIQKFHESAERVEASVETPLALRCRLVRDLLATLPEPQAETLALRVVLDYSMSEVAEATGVPLNTVRSRLRLAKAALKKRIEGEPRFAELLEAT